jgi:RNA polymerase sigma-70 factor (family 1)
MAMYSAHSDQELLDLLKKDDEAAFTEIYNRYWKKLFTAASNKLDDLAEAEDIVQQVFITIWNRRAVIEITSSLASYLAVAVKYHVFKSLDKNFKRRQFAGDDAAAAILEIADDSTRQWLEFQEVRERLGLLVAALPDKCRLVYQLSREQGHSQKQIAAELDISEKTVEAHMGKAIKSLKAGLKSFFVTL